MDFIFELLFELILAPIVYIFVEAPLEVCKDAVEASKLSKRRKRLVLALIASVFVAILTFAVVGGVLIGVSESDGQKSAGIALVSLAPVLLVGYFTFVGVCLHKAKKRKAVAYKDAPDKFIIGKSVHVIIDRPLGSTHPEHDDIVYGVNYGFVPEYVGGDGEAQDAYVLGVDTPLTEFDGVVTAIIQRLDDNEDKWVVVPDGAEISDDEIINRTHFQEQYFETRLIRDKNIATDISRRENTQTPEA